MAEKQDVGSETVQIPEMGPGLHAIVLPEFQNRDHFHQLRPGTLQETMGKLEGFLGELNRQHIDIVSIMEVPVIGEKVSGVVGGVEETKRIAIVRKTGETDI